MARRGHLIAVEGGSASGKTTLVRVAARRLGWRPIAEALDRLDPRPSIEFSSPRELSRLEQELLAEEAHRYQEARRWCDRGVSVLADTGFVGPLTYTRGLVDLGRAPRRVLRELERTARSLIREDALGLPDVTVYLRTTRPERAVRARAAAANHPERLRPRHEAVGRVEDHLYREVFPEILPDRFRTLRAMAGPIPLSARLGALVSDARTREPVSGAEAARVVTAIVRPTRPAAGRRAAPTVKKPTRSGRLPRDGR